MPKKSPCGFTLVECVIALALSSVVLLSARETTSETQRIDRRIRSVLQANDHSANGLRLARGLLVNAFQSVDSLHRFFATGDSVATESWCATPNGAMRRCRIALWRRLRGAATELYTGETGGDSVLVASLNGEARLAYLQIPRSGGTWIATWDGRKDFPVAVSFASPRDSITFILGYR